MTIPVEKPKTNAERSAAARERYVEALAQIFRLQNAFTFTYTQVARILGISQRAASQALNDHPEWIEAARDRVLYERGMKADKKVGKLDWRKGLKEIGRRQQFSKEASWSQDAATIHIITNKPIALVAIGDLHIGSLGTDVELLERFTDDLLSCDDVYIALLGDLAQHAINMSQGILAMMDAAVPVETQTEIVQSWFDEICPRVAFATWDNHSIARHERAIGESPLKSYFKKRVVYHNGIGHVDLRVGSERKFETYRIACAHEFRGRSFLNPLHAQQRYGRFEGTDREIIMSAHSHRPAIMAYYDGMMRRVALNCGSFQTDAGYTKRHFSLFTHPDMPCVVLFSDTHNATPFMSIYEWRRIAGLPIEV